MHQANYPTFLSSTVQKWQKIIAINFNITAAHNLSRCMITCKVDNFLRIEKTMQLEFLVPNCLLFRMLCGEAPGVKACKGDSGGELRFINQGKIPNLSI